MSLIKYKDEYGDTVAIACGYAVSMPEKPIYTESFQGDSAKVSFKLQINFKKITVEGEDDKEKKYVNKYDHIVCSMYSKRTNAYEYAMIKTLHQFERVFVMGKFTEATYTDANGVERTSEELYIESILLPGRLAANSLSLSPLDYNRKRQNRMNKQNAPAPNKSDDYDFD